MAGTRALVVAEPEGPVQETVRELAEALRADGFQVEHSAPGALTNRTEASPQPDLVLVPASLGLQRLALLTQLFVTDGRTPTTVVFHDGDYAALESCVRGGFDYVTPPFLPSLLRNRVSSCWERWQLTTTVEEMATAASLREYERELSIAHEIQSGFLPEELPTPDGWEVAARFEPAKQVGGDFYDVFELVNGRRLGFIVADVCDKGVGAALFMALIRTLMRHTAEHTGTWSLIDADLAAMRDDPEVEAADEDAAADQPGLAVPPMLSVAAGPLVQAVAGTNRYLARNHMRQGYFATLFFGVLDPDSGELLYINGGHNPPVVIRNAGGHSRLDPTGPAVGMLPNSMYMLGHTTLEPGDTLFMYTDGVVEARDPQGALFTTDRMLKLVDESADSAESLLGTVDSAISEYVGSAEQYDDITMLAVRRAEQ